jgi:nucleoside-diphosphate-sugar epimerase
MNILVTGSSGWLAQTLIPRLRRDGHAVTGLDPKPSPLTAITGSIADRALVARAIRDHRITAILHCGALHKPNIATHANQDFIDVNVTGTLNLLEEAVAQGVDRFVFTSTTSLMITDAIRAETAGEAVWLDETSGPLLPRNIYGVTKLSAEHLCRLAHLEHGLACMVLRTARFFPEEDDTHRALSGTNMKANEFLNRRLTVEDAARAHLVALEKAPEIGFGTFILSAPTPFSRVDVAGLKADAPAVIGRYFPEAAELYARQGWHLPKSIGRVYDAALAERVLGFRCETDFAAILAALRDGAPMPFAHDASYVSPMVAQA